MSTGQATAPSSWFSRNKSVDLCSFPYCYIQLQVQTTTKSQEKTIQHTTAVCRGLYQNLFRLNITVCVHNTTELNFPVQCSLMHFRTVQCSVLLCSAIQFSILSYSAGFHLLCFSKQCNDGKFPAGKCSALLITLDFTAQPSTALVTNSHQLHGRHS